jgi:hypothetical protein
MVHSSPTHTRRQNHGRNSVFHFHHLSRRRFDFGFGMDSGFGFGFGFRFVSGLSCRSAWLWYAEPVGTILGGIMALTDAERREVADRHIAGCVRNSKIAEQEGDYTSAANWDDEAAEWDFWAIHGTSRQAYDQAFMEANQ